MREKIIQLKNSGLSFAKVGEIVGCTSTKAYRIYHGISKKTGKTKDNKHRMLSSDLIDKIKDLRKSGVVIEDIRKELNVCAFSIIKYSNDVKTKRISKKPIVIKLYNEGLNITEISDKVGLSLKTVINYTGCCRPRVAYKVKVKPVKTAKPLKIAKVKAVKPVKAPKIKAVKPAIALTPKLQKGIAKLKPKEKIFKTVNPDLGRLVTIMYSKVSDRPTVKADIMVKDGASDEVAAARFANRIEAKSWVVC